MSGRPVYVSHPTPRTPSLCPVAGINLLRYGQPYVKKPYSLINLSYGVDIAFSCY